MEKSDIKTREISIVSSEQLRMTVYASLMAALIAAGAYIAIPVGPVPIVLQNLFVFLAGLILGSRWGSASVAIYLLAGICGLPIFAGGTGGIGRLAGITGGYLIGFLPAAFIIGFISEKKAGSIIFDVIAMICGNIIIYTLGVSWLKILSGMEFNKALIVGVYPFILGDILKIIAAACIIKGVRSSGFGVGK